MSATAEAANFTVTKLADDGTEGTLRKEILDANATATDDRILFQAGLSGTITLTTGEITIGDALEIVGPGADKLTVSADDASRIFAIGPIVVDAVTISALKLTGGGGGPIGAGIINSTANLTLSRSVMSGNHGTGGGTRGGAIANLGGTLTVTNSTFSGNSSGVAGGAIYTYNSPTTIESSTISGNEAGEGAGVSHYSTGVDPLTVRSSTIADNEGIQSGAGIYLATSGSSTLTNTIVADNVAPAQPDLGGNAVFDASFSLVENAPFLNETVPDSNITGVDPRLGPLANNGGPTQTRAPLSTSPAVDAGSAASPDQRGVARPIDFLGAPDATAAGANGADIGAVEFQPPKCKGRPATVIGGGGTTLGTADSDVIVGSSEGEVIKGLAGNDIVCAGGGADQVIGGGGNDQLLGGAGKDVLKGGAGRDTLSGQAGRDRLLGGSGRDILRGGPGRDTLRGGPGRDKLKGGPGRDRQRQ
jgi:predicted outer membrane repeat protein